MGWLSERIQSRLERDTDVAKYGKAQWREQRDSGDKLVRLLGVDEDTKNLRSFRARLARDLSEAFTDEEKLKVVEHYVQIAMHGGRERHVAERYVVKALKDIQED
jgi:hypothetical protein